MKLIINNKTYEIDRTELEAKLSSVVGEKVSHPPQEYASLTGLVRGAIGSVLAMLSMKHPDLRRPDGVDNLTHAANLVVKMALAAWEKQPIELTAKEEVEAHATEKN